MQTLKLLEIQTTENINQQIQSDMYMGIVKPLTDPLNLYLNIRHLLDTDRQDVYFFIYSLGKKRTVSWGSYNKYTKEFSFDAACKWQPNQINKMMGAWKHNDFEYIDNSVQDNITKTINYYAYGTQQIPYEKYLRLKYLYNYYQKKITRTELLEKYPNIFEIEDAEYTPKEIEQILTEHEKNINRTDLNRRFINTLDKLTQENIRKISARFYESMKYGTLISDKFDKTLEKCPDIKDCINNTKWLCDVYNHGENEESLL